PRTAELEQSLGKSSKDKSAPTLWVIALVSLTTGVLWSWRLGTSKTGERRYLIDLLETLPQAVLQSVLLVCDAGYVGYDLFGRLLKQQCSFLIRLSSQAQLYSLEMVKVEGFTEGEFWYWTDDAENKSKPALRVRVIRVAARKRKNDVWLVTNVLDPKRLPAELAARFYRMRWESECFFRTYKRIVKDVRLVSRTVPMVVREAEISLLACQLLLGQGALALKVGGKRAGRDELKCSAAEVLREIRRELDAARKPVPRRSFAKRLQQTGRERRERTGPNMKRQPPRRKKHVAPQPPRLKVPDPALSTRILGLFYKAVSREVFVFSVVNRLLVRRLLRPALIAEQFCHVYLPSNLSEQADHFLRSQLPPSYPHVCSNVLRQRPILGRDFVREIVP